MKIDLKKNISAEDIFYLAVIYKELILILFFCYIHSQLLLILLSVFSLWRILFIHPYLNLPQTVYSNNSIFFNYEISLLKKVSTIYASLFVFCLQYYDIYMILILFFCLFITRNALLITEGCRLISFALYVYINHPEQNNIILLIITIIIYFIILPFVFERLVNNYLSVKKIKWCLELFFFFSQLKKTQRGKFLYFTGVFTFLSLSAIIYGRVSTVSVVITNSYLIFVLFLEVVYIATFVKQDVWLKVIFGLKTNEIVELLENKLIPLLECDNAVYTKVQAQHNLLIFKEMILIEQWVRKTWILDLSLVKNKQKIAMHYHEVLEKQLKSLDTGDANLHGFAIENIVVDKEYFSSETLKKLVSQIKEKKTERIVRTDNSMVPRTPILYFNLNKYFFLLF